MGFDCNSCSKRVRDLLFLIRWPAIAFVFCLAILSVLFLNNRAVSRSAFMPEDITASFFRRIIRDNVAISRLRVIHDGYSFEDVPYSPQEEFYAQILRLRGIDAEVVTSDYRPEPGELLLWCGPNVKRIPRLRATL